MSERETNTRVSRSQHGHRSRKHSNNPSTEREQKKTSRIQTLGLGAGESIKEKQVSKRLRNSKHSIILNGTKTACCFCFFFI